MEKEKNNTNSKENDDIEIIDNNINNNNINNNKDLNLLNQKRKRDDKEQTNKTNTNNKINTKTNNNKTYNYLNNSNNSLSEKKRPNIIKTARECPYMGTIKRHMLDFDFEKQCSITFSYLNVYACLTCGKYYQGRGTSTLAYTHSLEADHHMFINLQDQKIYCLPDGYEINDNSLNDIKSNLKPIFNKKEIDELDNNINYCRALDGTEYLPGCIGLNNIKKTDYVNVIIQSLCRVSMLRDYFLAYEDNTTDLVN
jgi:U4/U6.U5 tri-snRNP-associated protein 2